MKGRRVLVTLSVLLTAFAFLTASLATANTLVAPLTSDPGPGGPPAPAHLDRISEETGIVASLTPVSNTCTYDEGYGLYLCPRPEPDPALLPRRDPLAKARARALLASEGVLLVPDSYLDRVMAFDPQTGDLVDANFIPSDIDHLSDPINAILSAGGDSILVADMSEDVVQEYDLDGNYIGVFAPAGGADTSILDNIRGIALDADGNLLVPVAFGDNADAIAQFDTSGTYLGNFVANGDGGLDSPFDVYQRPSTDWLVSASQSDAVHRYALASGAYITDLAAIDTFPEQIALARNGNILVGNFDGSQVGVLELGPDGSLLDIYDPPEFIHYRGVYELPNGNILTTNGLGVHEIDRAGNLVETKIADVEAHFVEFIPPELFLYLPVVLRP